MPNNMRISSKKFKSVNFYVLDCMNKHRGFPFVAKTLMWMLQPHDFKLKYMTWELTKMANSGLLTRYERGIYVLEPQNFKNIQKKHPELAKQISRKVKTK